MPSTARNTASTEEDLANQLILLLPYHTRAHAFHLRCLSAIPEPAKRELYTRLANILLNKLRNTHDSSPFNSRTVPEPSVLELKQEIAIYTWVSNRLITNERLDYLGAERPAGPMWSSEVTEGDEELEWRMNRDESVMLRSVFH